MHRRAQEGHRILVCAPFGRDAESVGQLLGGNGYDVGITPSLADLAARIDDHAGVVLLTEEALDADPAPLRDALTAQPAWSDVPIVLLASRGAGRIGAGPAIRRRLPDEALNVILLERPLSSESLVSTIAAAMRARQKQFLIRNQLRELEAERLRLSTLLENLPVGVVFLNPDGSTRLSNPAFRRFTRTGDIPSRDPSARDDWVGIDENGERIPPRNYVGARALRGETVAGIEFRYQPADAEPVWTRVSGVPLLDDEGTVRGAIAVVVDIDAQKRAQHILADAARSLEAEVAARTAELERALARLQAETDERARAEAALRQSQKMEAVGQLTGGIAHDFNNMLTGVIGAMDVMKRRIATGRFEGLDRFMDAASSSAQRAAALTARLLAFSRRQSLDSRPTDINALVGSLDDLLRRTMSERIEVVIEPAPDLPPGVADANQLENAILNLAINARDAMPAGGRLTIATALADLPQPHPDHPGVAAGRYVVVTVSDTGVGMDATLLDKVFDPFFTTKPIGQGTGLGLSMVYGFVKQSRGHVRIESTPGAGTSVRLYLPAAADDGTTERPAAPPALQEGTGQRVLLVEDDESVRLIVRDVLDELGYTAVEAPDPQTAIRQLEAGRRFDLMISDVGLPGMNGRQLAEIARAGAPELPILFITGYAENAAIRAGFLGTNMQMITKPFQIEVLAAKIGEMLR